MTGTKERRERGTLEKADGDPAEDVFTELLQPS
jgi:hypothetical protein